ncbi:MAG: hypothetical protein HY814_13045 [Candidatus Riflebacteria bacterium]|nr:hypothetical protein [Candidatus Riflebacteria bacterium]
MHIFANREGPGRFRGWLLAGVGAGFLLAAQTVFCQTAAPPAPMTTEALQRQYVEQVSQQVETVVQSLAPDLFQSDPFFSSRAAQNPDGRLAALALSREQEGESRWTILIVNKATLEVTQVYDYIRAHHLNKLDWSPDGRFLLVLAEDVQLSGPPGSLSVIDPASKRAYVVDREVWQYAMAPDGRELVYERCAKRDQPLGPREICHCDFAKLLETLRDQTLASQATPKEHASRLRAQTAKVLLGLDYPREQLEGFKSWSGNNKTLHMSVYRYAPGSQEATRVRYALDLGAGKATELSQP